MEHLALAQGGDARAFEALVAPYRRELRAYCYRMAGSIDDADDLLQESLLRAWRGLASYEGRATLRTWLHRVASSACIDRLKHRSARRRAEDRGPPARVEDPTPEAEPDAFIGPCPAALYADEAASPEALYNSKQSVSFAFLAALQLLPPKQRATLIACDVLGFSTDECAAALDASPAAVHSALRRARETIAERAPKWEPKPASEEATRDLLARYVDAWHRADARALVTLLHQDASMSMPPLPIWLSGPQTIGDSIHAMVFAPCSTGTFRARSTEANGLPALAIYRRGEDGTFAPFALHVLGIDGDKVRALDAFLDTRLFGYFDLPLSVP